MGSISIPDSYNLLLISEGGVLNLILDNQIVGCGTFPNTKSNTILSRLMHIKAPDLTFVKTDKLIPVFLTTCVVATVLIIINI